MTESAPLNVCLTFDFDAMSVWGALFGMYSPTPISRGEFGARVGTPRLLEILAREGVKATFFTPGHTIDSYPDLCRRIVAEGHEIGHHGYFHESPVGLSEAEERAALEQGLEAMDRCLDGYRPTGYRSPGWDLSPNSPRLLKEYGFKYDSSMMAQDFEPYWCRTEDRMPPDRGFEFGPEIDLVEVPVSWSLVDWPQLELVFHEGGMLPGVQNPHEIERRWMEELEFAAAEVPGGAFTITLHPQTIGRGARVRILERLIAKVKELGANTVTSGEVAESWRKTAPQPKPAGPPA